MAFGGPDKRNILQGVYEDNLRIKGRPAPQAGPRAPDAPATLRRRPARRVMLLLAAIVVVTGGLAAAGTLLPGAEPAAPAPAGGPPGMTVAAEPFAPPPLPEALPEVPGAAAYDAMLDRDAVPLADLFGLQVRTIVIDPGHGGRDPGAVGPGGLYEKDVVLDVARRLQRRLEARGDYRILLTREHDVKVPLKRRVAFANEHEADLFLSLHVNDLPVDSVAMVETYYFGPHTDEAALRSARRENQDSEYSIADFRDVIENIAGTVRLQESRDLAAAAQRSLYGSLRQVEPRLQSWGVKTAPFVVLLGVEAPAILAELSVMSHPGEAARLATGAHRERLAAALEQGLLDYLHPRLASGPAPRGAAHRSPTLAHAHGQEADH